MENNIKFEEYIINGKKYKMNIFETAKTKEDNYLLGYLLGDGGLNRETHKRKARMYVSSIDKYIMEFFRDLYMPDAPITSRIPVNNTRDIVSGIESHRLQFSSKFTNTFNKYGLVSVKEHRTFHNIKKEFMTSFILGLFDADGCFTWGRRKDRNRLWCSFLITHPSLNMLSKLQSFILEEYGVPTAITPKGEENCYILRTSSLGMCEVLMNKLYSDKPNIYNVRKYDNYKNFLTILNTYSYDKEKSMSMAGRKIYKAK